MDQSGGKEHGLIIRVGLQKENVAGREERIGRRGRQGKLDEKEKKDEKEIEVIHVERLTKGFSFDDWVFSTFVLTATTQWTCAQELSTGDIG